MLIVDTYLPSMILFTLDVGSAISVEFFHDVAQCQADNLEALVHYIK